MKKTRRLPADHGLQLGLPGLDLEWPKLDLDLSLPDLSWPPLDLPGPDPQKVPGIQARKRPRPRHKKA